ncbi:helix-turn-helix domain-containing protein [Pseudonocardia sp. EC080610-09]|uniref:helix-turn-helix domain-containing protein n=1 Tax=Pseudonocardia sp. EC080610-09 TaxID=1688404 RepID=UPI001D0566BA|nr:helix-turn-helix domain-containing protein [Pseudonocardia sp. EC080610-09]
MAEVVLHPVRLRVVQAVSGRELTTAQLKELLPDVAQATLYRQIAVLVEGGFLAVVGQRPIRGTVERTYGLGERMSHVGREELSAMADAQLRVAFLTFLGSLGEIFDRLLSSTDADRREFLGFGTGHIYLDEDDLAPLQRGFDELIAQYRRDAPGKRRVALSTVLLWDNE